MDFGWFDSSPLGFEFLYLLASKTTHRRTRGTSQIFTGRARDNKWDNRSSPSSAVRSCERVRLGSFLPITLYANDPQKSAVPGVGPWMVVVVLRERERKGGKTPAARKRGGFFAIELNMRLRHTMILCCFNYATGCWTSGGSKLLEIVILNKLIEKF